MSLFTRIIGKEKKNSVKYNIPTNIDMHSHLLPALDDGVQNYEESCQLILELKKLGYTKLITTPHIMGDMYRNSKEGILIELEKLRMELEKRNVDISIDVAAEYYIDEWFIELIDKNELLPIQDNFILIETNFLSYHERLFKEAVFKLKINGYKPIFAHPERYSYFWNDFEKYHELKDMEILFQINLVSLAGFYSPQVKNISEKLIDTGIVDLIGTDTHSIDYIKAIEKAMYSPYMEKLGNLKLLNKEL